MASNSIIDPQLLSRLIQSGIKSSIPWSREYNIVPEISNINKTLEKSLRVESRFKDINEKYRVRTLQKQRSLSNSLVLSQQRKNMLLNQKQKQSLEHSKRVNDKLSKFQSKQRSMLRKAAANQKKFSETICSYWKDKIKQNQQKQKRIYRLYSVKDHDQKKMSNSVQLMSIPDKQNSRQLMSATRRDKQKEWDDFEKQRFFDRGQQVRSRMQEITGQKYDNTFQKMMTKLAKIQRRKRLTKIRSLKTDPQEIDVSLQYQQSSSKHKKKTHSKAKIRIRNKIQSSNSFVKQSKIFPRHYENKEARQSLHQNLFDEHTQYLENYKHRMKEINNIKQLRDRIIQKKLYVERQKMRSNSRL